LSFYITSSKLVTFFSGFFEAIFGAGDGFHFDFVELVQG